MAKSASQHNIVPITLTLVILTLLTTLRGVFAPLVSELIPAVATPLGSLLQQLGSKMPFWSYVIWLCTLIYSGMSLGRCGIRFSIFPAYTVIGIPIFGIIASGILMSHEMLLSAAVLVVLLLATKYMLRYIMLSESYGDLSLSLLYFGLLPLLYAPMALLIPAMPVVLLLIKPYWRDWVTGVVSLLFPLLALCYWSWCGGLGFLSPAIAVYEALFTPSGFTALSLTGLAGFGIMLLVVVMVLCSVSLLISDKYALNGKARVAMRFNVIMILLAVAMLCVASVTAIGLIPLATAVSSLVPLMFIKMGRGFTSVVYRLLLLMTVLNLIILIFM